jgi:hypothetical protein
MLSDAYDMMTRTKAQIAGYGSNKPGAYKSKALRFVHSYGVPFGRLWYVKAALNHMVYQQMMEDLSPGYNDSERRRMAQQHQGSWWSPGTIAPQRAPDLGKVANVE